MLAISLLITALLFGGMVLFSFGFAAFVFNTLPAETAALSSDAPSPISTCLP